MLILTRKVGEEIVVANDIVIKVVRIDGNKVRIGITAPNGVGIDRKEIHERKKRESHQATPPAASGPTV